MSTIFPKWTNSIAVLGAGAATTVLAGVVGGVWYYFTPEYWEVGYMPTQPGGGFNHQLHAGQLGMDCRYCHSRVEVSAEANIPHVSVCNGCHAEGHLAKLAVDPAHKQRTEFIRVAWNNDLPIEWQRVHKLPDYVRNFPHNAHVAAGVSCISCHGNIARMPVVWQQESLSMGWCLDCHRNPDQHIVPQKGDLRPDNNKPATESLVTRLFDVEAMRASPDYAKTGAKLYTDKRLAAPENCGACHY